MGNQMCCDESHQQPGAIEELEKDVVHKISLADRNDEKHAPKKEEERIEFNLKEEPVSHEPPAPHPQVHEKVEQIEIPQLWPRVSDTLAKHRFFEFQTASIQPIRRKYGGDVYEGQLDEDKIRPHGFGKMHKEDGSLYIGHFKHGHAQGRGVFIFNNGSYYSGEFNNNKAETLEGQGFYESEDLTYTGGFKNNTFHGFGKEESKHHEFQGHYANGARTEGVLKWIAADGKYEYKGAFNQHNKFHGKGTLSEPLGVYQGDFADGEKHGEGEYRSKAGNKFIGHYTHNQRTGFGTIYNYDNSVSYKGELKNGLPHGKGTIPNPHGEGILDILWVEGIDSNLIPQQKR